MEPRLLNDVDIGQTFKFRVAFETLGQSKSSGKPMITIGLSLTTLGDIPIEKMVYLYFVSTVQWRINDFIAKIDKKHIHVEYYDNMWNGWDNQGTFKDAKGYCTIKKDNYGYKVDELLASPPKDAIITDTKVLPEISDDEIPF